MPEKLPRWKVVLGFAGYSFVVVALFPRAYRVFHPPLIRTPAGLALHLTYRVGFAYVTLRWLRPRMQAWSEREAAARAALVARLGREPTHEELVEDYGRRRAERK
jgi:hypothetical protein